MLYNLLVSTILSGVAWAQITNLNCTEVVGNAVKACFSDKNNPQLVQVAVDYCPKTCGYCCITPAFSCENKQSEWQCAKALRGKLYFRRTARKRVDSVMQLCKMDAKWILQQHVLFQSIQNAVLWTSMWDVLNGKGGKNYTCPAYH
ncbi:hypothetical protein COOONC_25072 [Cooperia oncophora]